MGLQIEDGHGDGFSAKVGKRGHLNTLAINIPLAAFFTTEGESFYFPGALINYTTVDVEQLLGFIKNARAAQFHITKLRCTAKAAAIFRLYKNPEATVNGVATPPVNANFESGRQFQGESEQGAEGATLTNGILLQTLYIPTAGGVTEFVADDILMLGNGNCLGMTVEVPVSTDVSCTVVGHYFA
jgi:hypothetical protein